MLYGDTGGLSPDFALRVDELLARCPGLAVSSGFRSTAQQTELYNRCLAERGSAQACRSWVAVPGRSLHESGLAVDLSGDRGCMAGLLAELGLCRPLPNEPWHVEFCGGSVQTSAQPVPVPSVEVGLPAWAVEWAELVPAELVPVYEGVWTEGYDGSGPGDGGLYLAAAALALLALYSW